MANYEYPIVNVDMDGVLADFDGSVKRLLLARDPNTDVSDPSSNFYITKRLKSPEAVAAARAIQSSRGFFLNLPLIDGAIDGWNSIVELGYQPRILSAPLTSNPWCTVEKLEWLDAHFGPEIVDKAIIDKNKAAYDGIALIDDRPVIDGAANARWQHVVFDQPYNSEVDAEFRLMYWRDRASLQRILYACAKRYDRLVSET